MQYSYSQIKNTINTKAADNKDRNTWIADVFRRREIGIMVYFHSKNTSDTKTARMNVVDGPTPSISM